ncbi:MAG: Lrp/AsnC ligand binding domain-containing protein, partial [Bacteroidales bacterium]|nr:Lrp/AsnC ligand binding domain-containing protein [Bacteroidales bacterium]
YYNNENNTAFIDMENFHLDILDKRILRILRADARVPFVEVARQCGVTGSAVHQRVHKMFEGGLLKGSQFNLSPKKLGYHTLAFVGIQVNLTSDKTHEEVFQQIVEIPEVVECHSITGKYSYMIKIYARNNEDLKRILVHRIQSILEVTGTETFLSLEEGFNRKLNIE